MTSKLKHDVREVSYRDHGRLRLGDLDQHG